LLGQPKTQVLFAARLYPYGQDVQAVRLVEEHVKQFEVLVQVLHALLFKKALL